MKKKSPIHAYKRLLAKDQDWDYAFLIALEKKKLQRMHDFLTYVNIRNERRFFCATPIRDAQKEGHRDHAILLIASLRQRKALHLYHLIREYKLFEWWD